MKDIKNKMQKYQYAVIAVDIVVFSIEDGKLKVLLIEMWKKPFLGTWAAPGGLVRPLESVDKAAARVLKEKSGISGAYLEQLYTFGRVDRDPFGRVVSVAYFALLPDTNIKIETTKDHKNIAWFNVNDLPKLAYDHAEIIKTAVLRLRAKLEYTNIVYGLLPNEFTLTDLQKVYEIILDRPLDKRNFRKKILGIGIIEKTGRMTAGQASRPAALYRFKRRSPRNIEML
jgi:8-oxo-dGTP diphosphatase